MSIGGRSGTRAADRRLWLAKLVAVELTLAAMVAGSAFAQARPGPAGELRPLSVHEVVSARSFPVDAPVRVSPDGRRVAYTIEGPQRTNGSTSALLADTADAWARVRVADLATGTVTELTPASSSWSPAWSPDGRTLAFHSNRGGAPGLWVWGPSRGIRRLTDVVVWTEYLDRVPRWSPDGTTLVVKVLPEGRNLAETLRRSAPEAVPVPSEPGTTARLFRSDDTGMSGTEAPAWVDWRYRGDLAAVDLESGAVSRLVTGHLPFWWRISPDGSRLAFSSLRSVDGDRAGFGLHVVSMEGGRVRELPGDVQQPFGDRISWSPTGARMAYVSDGGVFVVEVADEEIRRRAEARAGWSEEGGPVWTPDGRSLLFADGDLWRVPIGEGDPSRVADIPGRHVDRVLATDFRVVAEAAAGEWLLLVGDPASGRLGIARLNLESGTLTAERLEHGRFGRVAWAGPEDGDGALVSAFSSADRSPDLWLFDPRPDGDRRISTLNPVFDSVALGSTRRVEWTTDDGRRLQGTLMLPPDHREGRRLPMVVEVYGGGTRTAALHDFDRFRQLLATHGYAVLVPDIPLQTGAPMQGHAQAVVPGVDRVVDLGIADRSRIGVYGHSYGGYGVVALLALSDRFSAGVASAGHGNMLGMFGHLGSDGTSRPRWAVSGQGRMGATPWEDPTTYVENSPLFRLDRIEAPLLLLHGADDRNTPAYLAGQIFTGLRHLGRTVVLARYESEGHDWRAWRLPNKIDYWERLLGWFDEHL